MHLEDISMGIITDDGPRQGMVAASLTASKIIDGRHS